MSNSVTSLKSFVYKITDTKSSLISSSGWWLFCWACSSNSRHREKVAGSKVEMWVVHQIDVAQENTEGANDTYWTIQTLTNNKRCWLNWLNSVRHCQPMLIYCYTLLHYVITCHIDQDSSKIWQIPGIVRSNLKHKYLLVNVLLGRLINFANNLNLWRCKRTEIL